MRNTHLVANVNVRLNLDDMKKLKNEAKKLRVPVSTYCRTILTRETKDIASYDSDEIYSTSEDKPLSMAEAADWLGVSRTTFSRLVSKGELRYKSINPNNPKASKYFLKSDLKDWFNS